MSNVNVQREGAQEYPKVRPVADIMQQNDNYYILMDMPGVKKDDLTISVDKQNLTIEGVTSYPEKNEKYLENEFGNVHYIRNFTLSETIDASNIKANFKNGLLKLDLPKAKELQPRKIEIQNAE
jgi:HSP20 family molecular chaperone IbpA